MNANWARYLLGNHEAVSIINNYVQKDDVYYFTRKQPLEKEAKLPANLAKPIHKLVMSVSSSSGFNDK